MFLPVLIAVAALLVFVIAFLYPICISPLFNNLSPIEEGPLKNAILEAAENAKVTINRVQIAAASHKSSHSNAYVYGICNSKTMVIEDNLLKNFEQE